MAENAIRNQPSRHERDFHEWTRRQARAMAALERRRRTGTLPETCPYTVADAAFMPGPDWNDDDLIDA